MPERVDFELFVADARKRADRRRVISDLSAAVPEWLSEPENTMLLNYETSEQVQSTWDESSELLTRALKPKELLFVYVRSGPDPDASINNISFDEHDGTAILGVSISRWEVMSTSLAEIESRMVRLYGVVAAWSPCVLAAGPEFNFSEDVRTDAQALTAAFASSLVWWIAASEVAVPQSDRFERIQRFNEAVLLRRRDTEVLLYGGPGAPR